MEENKSCWNVSCKYEVVSDDEDFLLVHDKCWLIEAQVSLNRSSGSSTVTSWTPPSVLDGSLLQNYLSQLQKPSINQHQSKQEGVSEHHEVKLFNDIDIFAWEKRYDAVSTNKVNDFPARNTATVLDPNSSLGMLYRTTQQATRTAIHPNLCSLKSYVGNSVVQLNDKVSVGDLRQEDLLGSHKQQPRSKNFKCHVCIYPGVMVATA